MADRKSSSVGPDLDGLHAFLQVRDRDKAVFFVGREAEIAAVEKTAAYALAEVQKGAPASSMTLLFQGAPGVGKTSLLTHLTGRWGRRPDATVMGLRIDQDALASPDELARTVAKAVGKKTDDMFRQTRTTRTEYGGEAYIASIKRGHETVTAPPVPSLAALAERYPPTEWCRSLCLMVDEIQAVDPLIHGRALLNLHGGIHGLPIVPVYVGLGDARAKLAECELTRFSHGHEFTMGALAPKNAATAVRRFLSHFRVSASDEAAEWWSEQLAMRSDSWPQHLHTAMQGFAKELIVSGGRLDHVDSEAVFERGRRLRNASYNARVSPAMNKANCLVGYLMERMPVEGSADRIIIGFLTDRDQEMKGRPGHCLPEGLTATGFLDHLVHQGVLQRNEGGRLACPIPSFRDWLTKWGRDDAPGLVLP